MNKWTKFDTDWMFSLFGAAVGMGILFLPIRAGTGGLYPILVMSVLIFPMAFLSHRALSRFVSESKNKDDDITYAVNEYWGSKIGILLVILYIFAIYPVCLAYGVGITNTFESFFVNQMELKAWINPSTNLVYPEVRLLLAIILATFMVAIMILKEEWIIKTCNALVYPLCVILFAFSFYLIPHWKMDILGYVPPASEFIKTIWITLPILVFAFNYAPVISTFTLSVKRHYAENAQQKADWILFRTTLLLLFFTMFFAISCMMCLDIEDFALAKEQNIPILSYFANKFENPFISYGAPMVAFLAIVTSFVGHYFGAFEGINGIIRDSLIYFKFTPNIKVIRFFSRIFIYVTLIIVSFLNPSILSFIEDVGGTIIVMILFLMPVIGIWSVAKLKKYKNPVFDFYVFIMGLITISSVVYKLIGK